MNGYYYLPLTPADFAILVGVFLLAAILLLSTLRYAYLSLGVSSSTAMLLLFGSLIGSYFNIPIMHLPPEELMSDQVRDYFGMYWVVPHVRTRGPEIAVNVGGAVIPTIMSIYLLFSRSLWVTGVIATAIVALVRIGSLGPCKASALRCRYSCRHWPRRSSRSCLPAGMPPPSPTSPAAWGR